MNLAPKTKLTKFSLSKEAIEFMISQQYTDCDEFTWDGYNVTFMSSGKVDIVDIQQLIAMNATLAQKVLESQGALDYASGLITKLAGGKGNEEIPKG